MTENNNKIIGLEVIKAFAATLPATPGVYRMINGAGDVLYVGKAKDVKKRVGAYTRLDKHSLRIQRMITQTARMAYTPTETEAEAVLLETNLIKKLKPRYNILMRDDKSFPFISITHHDFPQVTKHRGRQKKQAVYFGPFASTGAVNRTLTILQRAFMLRNCSDAVFKNRKRPCLQYQIKRCTAPCVGYVDQTQYAEQVQMARDFLAGKSNRIQARFAKDMQRASDEQNYEVAAQYRDRIRALTTVQTQHGLSAAGIQDADVFALYRAADKACIQVFFFRGGQNYGNRAYFPNHAKDDEDAAILAAFMAQFYSTKHPPRLILVSHKIPETPVMQEALSLNVEYSVKISCPRRGNKQKLVERVLQSAKDSHTRKMSDHAMQQIVLDDMVRAFQLDGPPERIEIYDNSHISGRNAVGAMVVATQDGFQKNAYRTFNIKNEKLSPGDDYGMMREVLTRRFTRALKQDDAALPDLVIIDGGQGQLSAALDVLADLGVSHIAVVAIAKGPDRHAGREKFFMADRKAFELPQGSPLLYYLQRLRDEAHRFAIGTHRARRSKSTLISPLDNIPGIGPSRKKALLNHFGSAKAIADARLSDLESVEGISRSIAEKIYDYFNG